jgi:hypothetical protein
MTAGRTYIFFRGAAMKRLYLVMMLLPMLCVAYGQEKSATRTATLPSGYENVAWGTRLTEARDKIRGKLVFTDEKTLIVSREEGMENLEFYYGFFYIDPAIEGGAAETKPADATTGGQQKADEGKLFFVEMKFPYLFMDDVQKKIESKYGTYTDKNLIKNQGAVAWNGTTTIIIMWVDQYENRPFCRRITYVDKRITKELSDYQFRVFNSVELGILKKMGL